MIINRLKIIDRKREHPITIVDPSDFETCTDRRISVEDIVNDPHFSLYCIDPGTKSVLFVECDDIEFVESAPFLYQAQYQRAVSLASMPIGLFHEIGDTIPLPKEGTIWVHSVGRCGSTLLSKVLQSVPQTRSLSEPDDLTQLARLKETNNMPEAEVKKYLRSSIRWRSKAGSKAHHKWLAIKPRSEVMALAEQIRESVEGAKHFFLYRDAVSWMQSNFKNFPEERNTYDPELNQKMEENWARMLPLLREARQPGNPMNPIQVRTWGWITCMEAYLDLQKSGVPICAATYAGLIEKPEWVLKKFFEFYGIHGVDWKAIEEVLAVDSQAGTMFDREERKKLTRELTPELIQDIFELVASRPSLRTPDVTLPGTLGSS